MLEHAEAAPDGTEDRLLHTLGRDVVGRDHVERAARPGLGLGEIADRRLRELAVGDDHIGLVEGDHLRGPPVDLDDPADVGGIGIVLDPISQFERLFGMDGQPGEDVAERVLEGESEHRRQDRRSGEQVLGPHACFEKDGDQRSHNRDQPEHVEKDPWYGPADTLPRRHDHHQQHRLQERRQQEEADAEGRDQGSVEGIGKQPCHRQRQGREQQQGDRPPRQPPAAPGRREDEEHQRYQRHDQLAAQFVVSAAVQGVEEPAENTVFHALWRSIRLPIDAPCAADCARFGGGRQTPKPRLPS